MRRERVVVETVCDGCGEVIPTNGLQLAAGPLDFDVACASMGVCQSCGSLPSFPKQSIVVWGNCIGCWRRAMELARGKCADGSWGSRLVVALGKCAIGFPHNWHACRNLPGHDGGHECLCGAEWGGGL